MAGFGKSFSEAFTPAFTQSQANTGSLILEQAKIAQQRAQDKLDAASLNAGSAQFARGLSGLTGDNSMETTISDAIKAAGNNKVGAQAINTMVTEGYKQQLELKKTQGMINAFMNQGQNGQQPSPQTSDGTPQVSGSLGPQSGDNSGAVMPDATIGGFHMVIPSIQNKILAGQKATENNASLKLDAQKSFQTAAPVIASAINSLDDVSSSSQQLPTFDATVAGQTGAKASMALKAYAQDPAVAKYLATLGRVGPSLTRLNIGNSNRINVQELNATKQALGETTTPLATKMDLIDSFRDSVVKPLQVEARAAGYTPEKLKTDYPDAYKALYMRRVQDPKTGKTGYVPIDQYKKALDKGYKRV